MQFTTGLGAAARDFLEEDLMECLLIQPGRIGSGLIGRDRAFQAWKILLRSRSSTATVIEAPRPIAGQRILGFGAAVFVSQDFAEAEISNPRPGVNSRIIASVHSGRQLILTEAELRSANTKGELNLVILYGSWRRGALTPAGAAEVGASLASRFLETYQGYRMSRLISEAVGVEENRRLRDSHIWRTIRDFGGSHGVNRSLWVVTRQEGLETTGSILNPLFHHKAPLLGLRDVDQQFLLAALPGSTDQELSRKLDLSVAAVKKRWTSLFVRTVDLWPDRFPDVPETGGIHKRGPQKRHHLLAYIRSHPEELRPFDWGMRTRRFAPKKGHTDAIIVGIRDEEIT